MLLRNCAMSKSVARGDIMIKNYRSLSEKEIREQFDFYFRRDQDASSVAGGRDNTGKQIDYVACNPGDRVKERVQYLLELRKKGYSR